MSVRLVVSERGRQRLGPWYGPRLLDGVPVVRGSLLGWLFGRFGQHAVTINRTVHLAPSAPDLDTDEGVALLGHELFHVMQQTEMGWWPFFLRYVVHWRPYHVRQGWRHPLEKPACDRGRQVWETLREGQGR